MGWTPLLSTLVGGLIGIVATLVVDRTHATRERADRSRVALAGAFAEYLSALSRTRNEIHIAAHPDGRPLEIRAELARDAFKAGGAYELRYRVALLAAPSVVSASDAAIRRLRAIRDVVTAGSVRGEPAYVQARDTWQVAFDTLITTMRGELNA